MRPSGRKSNELRSIELIPNFAPYAEGSCLVKFGNTHVLCTATIEYRVPFFLKDSGSGWVTAEYGMLPRATQQRTDREAKKGAQSGRTQEIQRLIGRALRAVTDLKAFPDRQIRIDCDVIQADGGTRTAAITGSYVALYGALEVLRRRKDVSVIPLKEQVAAISCGVYKNTPVLDLDYEEDSQGDADANFVMTASGKLVEVQASGEEATFSEEQFLEMLTLAKQGVSKLVKMQLQAIGLKGSKAESA